MMMMLLLLMEMIIVMQPDDDFPPCVVLRQGNAKDRENVLKLLRTWKDKRLFERSITDEIDRIVSKVFKFLKTS
jgi:hypothetical protein